MEWSGTMDKINQATKLLGVVILCSGPDQTRPDLFLFLGWADSQACTSWAGGGQSCGAVTGNQYAWICGSVWYRMVSFVSTYAGLRNICTASRRGFGWRARN